MTTPWEKKNAFRVRRALANAPSYEDCLRALRSSRDACPAKEGEGVAVRTARIVEHAVAALKGGGSS